MSLTGSTNEAKIWNYLYKKIGNAYGVAGLMGNLYAESGLVPQNLQNTYNTKLGMTDAEYTAAVDDGSYTKFSSDSAGYGLAQWTYSTRKKNMYDYIVTKLGKSIGDLESQLAFLISELSGSYSAVYSVLKSATSVEEASTKVLTGYEKPADQSSSVQSKRAGYGESYYKKYAGSSSTSSSSSTTSSSSSSVTKGQQLTLKNCPLYVNSTTTTKAKTVTGTYYIWSAEAVNERYRITNAKSKCGVSGQVTGWIDLANATSTSSTSVKAGQKLSLKSCPLYVSSTAKSKTKSVTGTYYLWSATAVNDRYRITNKTSNVGKAGQITGWIDSDDIG